jgi:transposase
MDGQQKYELIKNLVDHGGNKNRAAIALDCSRRTIDRYIAGYRTEGKAYFIHGNEGRKPVNAMDEKLKADIVDLYFNKYCDANFSHFTQLLLSEESIAVSESLVRHILTASEILSPKATRKKRREFKKRLEAKLAGTKNTKEVNKIKSQIIAVEEAHPRRPRCSRFGEMIQMDASLHFWIPGQKWTLHLAIDDATGTVVGAWFEEQETLRGYYNVLHQILIKHGIPYMFYTDRRTVFEFRKSGSQDSADDSFTQFSYACKQLGIQIETTSIPQAKGRVERLIQTMQSRLPVELRLKGVNTLEQANEFLADFIANYNARFALRPDFMPSVFETQPSQEKIDLTLAVITERTVDGGHSLRFDNKFFRTLNKTGEPIHLRKGTKGLVIRSFTGSLFYSIDDRVLALEEIPSHERSSRNFDSGLPAIKPKRINIPAPNHPWRLRSFASHVQRHSA